MGTLYPLFNIPLFSQGGGLFVGPLFREPSAGDVAGAWFFLHVVLARRDR